MSAIASCVARKQLRGVLKQGLKVGSSSGAASACAVVPAAPMTAAPKRSAAVRTAVAARTQRWVNAAPRASLHTQAASSLWAPTITARTNSSRNKTVMAMKPLFAAQKPASRQLSTTKEAEEKPVFDKILIANRGEIACRVIKSCKKLGIKTVAVYSEPDEHSKHVQMADEAVCVGPAASAQSYLRMDKILEACKQTGAQAVHPGYGFLSENQEFCKLLEENGIVFIGPKVHAINSMGLKIESKKIAKEAGVSLIPGFIGAIRDEKHVVEIANDIGYPVMIKASAGGGGKGMRIAWNDKECVEGFRFSKAEATKSFGNDTILVEKYIDNPRHIEIQVLCDSHGNGVYLNERECSIQRRNQKVIEEAPSTFLDAATRKQMGEQAVALAKAVQYQSAGTVEFLVDSQRNFYFLEMNTRLQVEHPITEQITGVDLVEGMLRVAAGQKLHVSQEDIGINGWAFECRVYAEDPFRGFLPSIGVLTEYREPTDIDMEENEVVRCDSGITPGSQISMHYDPLICKLVTHGATRDESLQLMRRALDSYVIRGVNHNISFLRAVCDNERFKSGNISTKFIEEEYPDGFEKPSPTSDIKSLLSAAALIHASHLERLHSIEDGGVNESFRRYGSIENQQDRLEMLIMRVMDDEKELAYDVSLVPPSLMGGAEDGESSTYLAFREHGNPEAEWEEVEVSTDYVYGDLLCRLNIDDTEHVMQYMETAPYSYEIQHSGSNYSVRVCTPEEDTLLQLLPKKTAVDTSKFVLSPMPGSMVSVDVKPGDTVVIGQAVGVVEAMKMQNLLRAEKNGTIKSVNVKVGDTVAADQILIELA